MFTSGELLGILELSVPGIHNPSNALAAVAVGRFIGLPFEGISESLKTFRGPGAGFSFEVRSTGLR